MDEDSGANTKGGTKRLNFLLTADQAGPFPVSTETIWCQAEGDNYRVKNVPFFIDDISFDDVIAVRSLGDGFFKIVNVVTESGNSTVWLYFKGGADGTDLTAKLLSIGCGVEGGVIDGYYAINVPEAVDINLVYSAISESERHGLVIADYPSIRH